MDFQDNRIYKQSPWETKKYLWNVRVTANDVIGMEAIGGKRVDMMEIFPPFDCKDSIVFIFQYTVKYWIQRSEKWVYDGCTFPGETVLKIFT